MLTLLVEAVTKVGEVGPTRETLQTHTFKMKGSSMYVYHQALCHYFNQQVSSTVTDKERRLEENKLQSFTEAALDGQNHKDLLCQSYQFGSL